MTNTVILGGSRLGGKTIPVITPQELAAIGYTSIDEVGEIDLGQIEMIRNRLAAKEQMVPSNRMPL